MLLEKNVTSYFGVLFGGPYELIGVRRRVHAAERAMPRRAKEVAAGERVRIDGTVEASEPVMVAPFTSEPSVYWHVRLMARRVIAGMNLGINTPHPEVWTLALVLSSSESFWIMQEDGTRVLVDVSGHEDEDAEGAKEEDEPRRIDGQRIDDALIAIAPMADVSDHPAVNDEDEVLNPFLRRHDIMPIEEMGRSGNYRFLEARIVPGQRITAYGLVAELPTRESTAYRDAAHTVRRLVGTRSAPLVIVASA